MEPMTAKLELELETLRERLAREGYVADRELTTAIYLSLQLEKPLLVEGPAGVGKTELAKVLARVLGTELIRLQCYEGLDAAAALYEWNYPKQVLQIRLAEAAGNVASLKVPEIFTEEFLLERPLLKAIRARGSPPVLLIDEVDRSDEEFESFLLEVLSDFQVSIPELGTVRAERPPRVVVTSNRTRELSDALRRRCLYVWVDYPDLDRELTIVRTRLPGIDQRLAEQVVRFVHQVRQLPLDRPPGVAETLDWARALVVLHADVLGPETVEATLGLLAKTEPDLRRLREAYPSLVRGSRDAPATSQSPSKLELAEGIEPST